MVIVNQKARIQKLQNYYLNAREVTDIDQKVVLCIPWRKNGRYDLFLMLYRSNQQDFKKSSFLSVNLFMQAKLDSLFHEYS